MKIQLTTRNVSKEELAKALAGIVTEEGVTHEVHEHLATLMKSGPQEGDIIPERYVRYIGGKLNRDFNALLSDVSDAVETWVLSQSKLRKAFLRKAEDAVPILSQEQLDELRALIEARFRAAIGINYGVSDDVRKKWEKLGIKMHDIRLDEWFVNAYVSGRVANLLNDNTSFAEMMKIARKQPLSRLDQLVIDISKQNSARFITGYGEKLGRLAVDVALDQHKKAINEVIQSYFQKDLYHEIHPESGYLPNETSVIKRVTSWRQLASELRYRFRQTDIARDWERAAFTEMRFAVNLGKLQNIQHEGGGDPEDIEVFYHVLKTACPSCRKLYLNSDGTPKIFKLSEILQNVQETGGMNIGRKASTIGGKDGWLPNAVVHPNCHCYPVRKIGGYKYAEYQREETGEGTEQERQSGAELSDMRTGADREE